MSLFLFFFAFHFVLLFIFEKEGMSKEGETTTTTTTTGTGLSAEEERRELEQAFVDCARYNDLEVLIAAIGEEPELVPDARDGFGNTALHMAAANGHAEVVRVLLSRKGSAPFSARGADAFQAFLDARNESGNTALHWAAQNNRAAVVRLLCEAGARVDIPNASGKTPLNEANMRAYEDVIVELLKATPDEVIDREQRLRGAGMCAEPSAGQP